MRTRTLLHPRDSRAPKRPWQMCVTGRTGKRVIVHLMLRHSRLVTAVCGARIAARIVKDDLCFGDHVACHECMALVGWQP